MARVHAQAEKSVAAEPKNVYEVLADYATHHPRIMPADHFSSLEVESGGVGDGTVFHITARVGGKKQRLHMRVTEPDPGRVLRETNVDTGVATDFTVTGDGSDGSVVRMSSEWEARGLRGIVDRLVAPRVLNRLFAEQLEQLDAYMRSKEVRAS
jgi:hypothetical protein